MTFLVFLEDILTPNDPLVNFKVTQEFSDLFKGNQFMSKYFNRTVDGPKVVFFDGPPYTQKNEVIKSVKQILEVQGFNVRVYNTMEEGHFQQHIDCVDYKGHPPLDRLLDAFRHIQSTHAIVRSILEAPSPTNDILLVNRYIFSFLFNQFYFFEQYSLSAKIPIPGIKKELENIFSYDYNKTKPFYFVFTPNLKEFRQSRNAKWNQSSVKPFDLLNFKEQERIQAAFVKAASGRKKKEGGLHSHFHTVFRIMNTDIPFPVVNMIMNRLGKELYCD